MTFWRFIDHDPERPLDPAGLGRSLRELHDALADYGGELPRFTGALREIEQMLTPLGPEADPLRAELARLTPLMLETKLPSRPLHGDASMGNVLRSPAGLLWTDFEDVCAGPVALELAGLAVSAEMRGHGPDFTVAIVRGYGDTLSDEELEPFGRLGALYATAWTSSLAPRRPELRDVAAARFRWWERRVREGGH
jgi:Ser/Thr protein kinase RdoA (MazF antagonist)